MSPGTRGLLCAAALAAAAPARAEPKRNVFSVGLSGARHSLKAGDGNSVQGNSGAVQLGYGYVADSWFFGGSLDILLGPYEPARGKELDVDYVGTGATLWTGLSAQTLDLRSPAGGYGFGLGLTYQDTVGRSVAPGAGLDEYVIRVTSVALTPGIFFSWLSPARQRGHTPELLKTRLEGFILNLGAAMPLLNSYKAKYLDVAKGETVNEKGRLRGYSIQMTLTAVIGA